MEKSGIIFITSTGLSDAKVYGKFQEFSVKKQFKKAVIITTAASEKENNQYSKLAKNQLESLGFSLADFYDFEKDGKKDLSGYDVIYVCGGNTFRLMESARKADFGKEIKALLERGGIYIGVSAGGLIIGPSIRIAGEINPDANESGTSDFDGFNIVDFVVFPHYSEDFEQEIQAFETKQNVKVQRISNSQAIVTEGGRKTLIG